MGPKPEKFGDQITADHLVKIGESHSGSDEERVALVVTDRATGFLGVYPAQRKSGDETEKGFRHFQ